MPAETAPKPNAARPLPDLSDIFAKYMALAASVDRVFDAVKDKHPDAVTCTKQCADCCSAVFDLSLVEALYLNRQLAELEEAGRQKLLVRADKAERAHAKLARQTSKAARDGIEDDFLLNKVAEERIRCPLLGEEDTCDMYDHRPLTCRLYGVPQNIGGKAHVCGLSGFDKGGSYPAVTMEKIQDALMELSLLLADRLGSSYAGLASTHMPLATALITKFDAEFLGLKKSAIDDDEDDEDAGCGCGGSCQPQAAGCTPSDCASCDKTGTPDAPGGCPGSPEVIEFKPRGDDE